MNKRYGVMNVESRVISAFIEVEETKAQAQCLAQQALYPNTVFVEVDPMTPTANYWMSPLNEMVNLDEQ